MYLVQLPVLDWENLRRGLTSTTNRIGWLNPSLRQQTDLAAHPLANWSILAASSGAGVLQHQFGNYNRLHHHEVLVLFHGWILGRKKPKPKPLSLNVFYFPPTPADCWMSEYISTLFQRRKVLSTWNFEGNLQACFLLNEIAQEGLLSWWSDGQSFSGSTHSALTVLSRQTGVRRWEYKSLWTCPVTNDTCLACCTSLGCCLQIATHGLLSQAGKIICLSCSKTWQRQQDLMSLQ